MASTNPLPATFNCSVYTCSTVSGCPCNANVCSCNSLQCVCNCNYLCTCNCNNCTVNSANVSTNIPSSFSNNVSILLQDVADIKNTLDAEYDRRINDKSVYNKPTYDKSWSKYNTSNINATTWKEIINKITSYTLTTSIDYSNSVTSADIINIRSAIEKYTRECLCNCNRTANVPSSACTCQSYNSNSCYCQCNYYTCTCQCDYHTHVCSCNYTGY